MDADKQKLIDHYKKQIAETEQSRLDLAEMIKIATTTRSKETLRSLVHFLAFILSMYLGDAIRTQRNYLRMLEKDAE